MELTKIKKIKKRLTFEDMFQFVETAASLCFDEDTGEYFPQLREFVIKCEILTRYASITLPDNLDEKYSFVYGNRLVKRVLRRIDRTQLHEITEAVYSRIIFLMTSPPKKNNEKDLR